MKWNYIAFILGACLLLSLNGQAADKPLGASSALSQKPVYGWAEKALISPGKLILHAKLAPATVVLSVNAQNIKTFKRGGEKFVRFELSDRYGNKEQVERPLIRVAKIKRLSGSSQKRYVVELGICVGSIYQEEEVTLVDRSSHEYDMVIGREFLAGRILVDPASSFTREPKCTPGKDSISMLLY